MTSSEAAAEVESLDDFDLTSTTYGELTYDVYRSGTGPAVIVMPEMPGFTPNVARFARRVRELGLTVFVPSMFGTPGKHPTNGYVAASLAKGCVAKEFGAFATSKPAPITNWLRALARDAHAECGGPGVGAVGMCFTGGFALAMATDPSVIAPVMSQPSLPIGITPKLRRSPGVTPDEAAVLVERARTEGLCAIGLRFTGDPAVRPERFEALRSLLGDAFISTEIDSSKDNAWGIRKGAHSMLTEDLDSSEGHPTAKALDDVLGFLSERLLGASD